MSRPAHNRPICSGDQAQYGTPSATRDHPFRFITFSKKKGLTFFGGKHAGQSVSSTPVEYRQWIVENIAGLSEAEKTAILHPEPRSRKGDESSGLAGQVADS